MTDAHSRADGNNILTGSGTGSKADTAVGCTITRNTVQFQAGGKPYVLRADKLRGLDRDALGDDQPHERVGEP